MKKTKPKTYQQGASDERKAILAHVRRIKRDHIIAWRKWRGGSWSDQLAKVLQDLESWLLKRSERYNRRCGGLQGRKKCK